MTKRDYRNGREIDLSVGMKAEPADELVAVPVAEPVAVAEPEVGVVVLGVADAPLAPEARLAQATAGAVRAEATAFAPDAYAGRGGVYVVGADGLRVPLVD